MVGAGRGGHRYAEEDADDGENGPGHHLGGRGACGILRAGERLRPSDTATTVRAPNGKAQVVNGPYAELKEQFGGFYLIDVGDLDEAIKWAARCPSAEHGAVEVSHVNLNDDVVEGLSAPEVRAFSVQYHPEAAPGPNDARYLFRTFADAIATRSSATAPTGAR